MTYFLGLCTRAANFESATVSDVGDIRAINAQFVDAYQLKTVDTIQESDLSKFGGFVRSDEGKIRMESSLADEDLFREDADGPLLDADGSRPFDWWDVVIRCTGWEFDSSIFDTTTQPAMVAGPASHKYPPFFLSLISLLSRLQSAHF